LALGRSKQTVHFYIQKGIIFVYMRVVIRILPLGALLLGKNRIGLMSHTPAAGYNIYDSRRQRPHHLKNYIEEWPSPLLVLMYAFYI
jgi:hypothetical protein